MINDLSAFASTPNVFVDRGLDHLHRRGTGPGRYPDCGSTASTSSAKITASTGVDRHRRPTASFVLTYAAATPPGTGSIWTAAASPRASPIFLEQISRAGILEAYAYYVDNNMVLRRVAQRNAASTHGGEPVAVNIGNLQVELGIDVDGDTFLDPATEWDASPTLAEALAGNGAVAMRLTVLGRTPFEVPDWTEPARTFAGAGNMTAPARGRPPVRATPSGAGWRSRWR